MQMEGPDNALAVLARAYLEDVDRAVLRASEALAGRGLAFTCGPGCHHCCSLPVNVSRPEAVLAAGYVTERFSQDEALELIERARAWVTWTRDELPRLAYGTELSRVYAVHGPGCPLLSGGLCSIYPVRPMGCRVHSSTSEPRLCSPGQAENPLYDPSGMVEEVVRKVKPLCMDYQWRLEGMGVDFAASLRPLPEHLIELLGGAGSGRA